MPAISPNQNALVKGRDIKRLLADLARLLPLPGRDFSAKAMPDGVSLSARPGGSTWGNGEEPFRVLREGDQIWVVPSTVIARASLFGQSTVYNGLRPFSDPNVYTASPAWEGGASLATPVTWTGGAVIVAIRMEMVLVVLGSLIPAFSPMPTVGLYAALPARQVPTLPGETFVWYVPLAVVEGQNVYQLALGPLVVGINRRGPMTLAPLQP
jgi:hypothetical protein